MQLTLCGRVDNRISSDFPCSCAAQAQPCPIASSSVLVPESCRLAVMGGHQRFFHPNWFSRYIWGIIASVNLGGFLADQQYGVDRSKNPNIMWPWWHEIMRKKEKGEIPMDMPGYMLAKFRNESEERWTAERSHEFEEYLSTMGAEE
ncbi:unnamed protein product [Symbiodinium microadriaticum]|nr:unnamed protein product [Symbiodinium microadriaticum]CAE7401064.1 unnamed protein product [Symbiodinium sp. KB8]